MGFEFHPPPNWPQVPPGRTSSPGWRPPAEWPEPPKKWQLWTLDPESPTPAVPGQADVGPAAGKPGLFGARKRARELEVKRRAGPPRLGSILSVALERRGFPTSPSASGRSIEVSSKFSASTPSIESIATRTSSLAHPMRMKNSLRDSASTDSLTQARSRSSSTFVTVRTNPTPPRLTCMIHLFGSIRDSKLPLERLPGADFCVCVKVISELVVSHSQIVGHLTLVTPVSTKVWATSSSIRP